MKRTLAIFLCAILLILTFPGFAAADSDYSTVSNRGVCLRYPEARDYFDTPFSATVKPSHLYFMPRSLDGHGYLGTVSGGTAVTVWAENAGCFFFETEDGRCGWNSRDFFRYAKEDMIRTRSAGGFSTVSDTGAELCFPDMEDYYDTPFPATVNSGGSEGCLAILPAPSGEGGQLGTVRDGTAVTILAEKSGCYFFEDNSGRCGWNGKDAFSFWSGYAEKTPGTGSYPTVSDENVPLLFPQDKYLVEEPFYRTVRSSHPEGSICLMPRPQSGNGELGTVRYGETVRILAEAGGFYFFQTPDGRFGWNGAKWFAP